MLVVREVQGLVRTAEAVDKALVSLEGKMVDRCIALIDHHSIHSTRQNGMRRVVVLLLGKISIRMEVALPHLEDPE